MSELHEAPVEEQQAPEVAEAPQDDDLSLEESLAAEFDRQDELPDEDDDPVIEASTDEPVDHDEPDADPGELEYESAPERWPDEIKTVYDNLPTEGKKAMLDGVYKPMQRSFTQKTQELANMRRKLDPLLNIVTKHSDSFQRAGIDPAAALERQMEWSAHFAKVGNEQGAKDLAAAYAGQNTGQQETSYLTPVEKQHETELNSLKQQLDSLKQQDTQRQQQAQQARMAQEQTQVQTSIKTFANEMRDGKPAHPHLEAVSQDMARLINGGMVDRTDMYGQPMSYRDRLDNAYTLACRMNPNISNTAAPTRSEQVARASAANREVVSKSPGGRPDVEPQKLSDDLSDLYDRLNR